MRIKKLRILLNSLPDGFDLPPEMLQCIDEKFWILVYRAVEDLERKKL